MSVDEYLTFIGGVKRLAGVDLSQYKRAQMERRIRSYAERQQSTGLAGFLTNLEKDPNALEGFLDRVTINVSELYRNPEQYEMLRTRVLPELAKTGALRIWSAGCSYGAEAYTLACVVTETLAGQRYEIHGSDIDKRILERAARGWFSTATCAACRRRCVSATSIRATTAGWRATRYAATSASSTGTS